MISKKFIKKDLLGRQKNCNESKELKESINSPTKEVFVKFWRFGVSPLKVVAPELFSIACDRDTSVTALMLFGIGMLHWELNILRNVQDW